MIVTVTPNPSVDRTVFVDALRPGKIMRSDRSWSEPSGKGVNVALALQARGNTVIVGGRRADLLEQIAGEHPGLDTERIDTADPDSIAGAVTAVR